jgi:LmbE family N-acetylglucosaminyl deacetylase
MIRHSFAFASVVLVAFLVLARLTATSHDHRYFPETGPPSIHQRALDLYGGAVVLVVALQPGYEDLNLLSYLRLGLGARTYVLYWTNGEGTPNDADGASPMLLAAARREEAYQAATLLGARVHYLNFPDPGVISRQKDLSLVWNSDSTLSKLVPLIRSYGPDAIVIGGDFRGDTVRSARQRALTGLMLAAVKRAAKAKADSIFGDPWHVQRVLVQTDDAPVGKEQDYDRIHPFWKSSYRSIAQEAVREYSTLRCQLPSWIRRGDRHYAQVFPTVTTAAKHVTAGLPVISAKLKSLSTVVRDAAGKEVKGVRSTSLGAVARAIDSMNVFFARYRPTLTTSETRVASLWKNNLEDLRCSVLDVSITYQSSDSLVTQSQLFYLRFTGFTSQTSKTHTKILFPGVMEKKWGVNESAKFQYDFATPQEYRVITPKPMDFNVPGAQFGIARPFARNHFSFLINHQDSLPGKDFVYRGDLLLQSAPRRTFELLTPAVRALEGEPVVFRLINVSRDAFEGTISLEDSVLNTTTAKVRLLRKDEVLLDTLSLSFKQSPPAGSSIVLLSLSGMGGSIPVVIRRFDVEVDSSARIVLLSDIEDSPLTEAMRRLRLPFRIAGDVTAATLESANILVIDRDALAGKPLTAVQIDSLHMWVRQGGHLLVFPQPSSVDRGSSLVPWASFENGPLSAADDSVVVTPGNGLLSGPNHLTPADWSHWVLSRSMWSLRVQPDHASEIVVRSAQKQIPLLLVTKEGKGRVSLVALDLSSQLVNLHPGVHRLLANLLQSVK